MGEPALVTTLKLLLVIWNVDSREVAGFKERERGNPPGMRMAFPAISGETDFVGQAIILSKFVSADRSVAR